MRIGPESVASLLERLQDWALDKDGAAVEVLATGAEFAVRLAEAPSNGSACCHHWVVEATRIHYEGPNGKGRLMEESLQRCKHCLDIRVCDAPLLYS